MVMKSKHFSRYIDPIITDKELSHLTTVRIGTKSLSYWPYRFITDDDADEMLKAFERIVNSGKHLSIMAHFTHW